MHKIQKELLLEALNFANTEPDYASNLINKALAYGVNSPPSGFLDGSIFKDPVYHGSDTLLEEGDTLDTRGKEYGIYVSPNRKYAKRHGKYMYECLINIKKPLYVEGKYEISPKDLTKEDAKKINNDGYDCVVVTPDDTVTNASEIVLFDPDKIFIVNVR